MGRTADFKYTHHKHTVRVLIETHGVCTGPDVSRKDESPLAGPVGPTGVIRAYMGASAVAPQGGTHESMMARARRLSGMLRKSLLSGEQPEAETSMPRPSLTCTPSRTAMVGTEDWQ